MTADIRWARGAPTGNRPGRKSYPPPWHAVSASERCLMQRPTACRRRLRTDEVERGPTPPTDGSVCPDCAIDVARRLDAASDPESAMEVGLAAMGALLNRYRRMDPNSAAAYVTQGSNVREVTSFTCMDLTRRYYAMNGA